jgi:hypothetical protein
LARLYGRTGRLTSENGDFRPGQGRELAELLGQSAVIDIMANAEARSDGGGGGGGSGGGGGFCLFGKKKGAKVTPEP